MSRNGKRGRAATSFYFKGQRSYRVYPRRDNGRWYADYFDNGRRIRVTLDASTRPEAEAAVRDLDGGPGDQQPTARSAPPVAEAIAGYVEHCRGRVLAASTLKRYGLALNAFIRFGAQEKIPTMAQVRLTTLEKFHAHRTLTEKMDCKTAYTDALVIKGFFKYAAHPDRGIITSNPGLSWKLREPVKQQPYCYKPEEVEVLLAGCRDWLKPVLTTLAFTGMRIGELINLRPEDVDLDEGLIHVRVREDWKPKGRRDRTIPMHPRVEKAITKLKPGKFYFMGPNGGKLTGNNVLKALTEDRTALGIKKGTLHTFRHFFVSLCASSGKVPLSTCMTWVGHRDAEMVWHYYHLSETASREAMNRLGGVE